VTQQRHRRIKPLSGAINARHRNNNSGVASGTAGQTLTLEAHGVGGAINDSVTVKSTASRTRN